MALKPKLAVKILRSRNRDVFVPAFHAEVDQVIGLNADWFKLHIMNKDNKFDELVDEADTLQVQIYIGYSQQTAAGTSESVAQDLRLMMHGWVGRISGTYGSVGRMMTIEGGDVSYVLNQGYTGDLMARMTKTEKAMPLQDSHFYARTGWDIIRQVCQAEQLRTGVWRTPEGVEIVPFKSFQVDKTIIGGQAKPDYPSIVTIPEDEKIKLNKEFIYQVNNNTRLEVIDDVCAKTGFFAWVDPGTRQLRIGRKEDYAQEKIDPLKSWGSFSMAEESQQQKGSWIRFRKVPHFEDGLQLEINYWDWEKELYGEADQKDKNKTLTKGRAHFLGNPNKDAKVLIRFEYEPVSRESADMRAYKAINRIVSQRVVAKGQAHGYVSLLPNTIVPVEGCGRWDGEYLVTHTQHVCGSKGYSTLFDLRLPDLGQSKNDEDVKESPFKTVKIGGFVR